MSKKLLPTLIVSIMLVMAFSSVAPVVAFAHDGEDDDTIAIENATTLSDDKSGRGEQLRGKIQELKDTRQENKEKRLDAAKLKVCENRKTRITAILNRSITRAERQLELFTKISERVKTFYTEKGYSIENYDALVAAVDTAKANAEANLETLKGLSSFDCDADDPKGNAEAFKLALQSVRQDLKDYRTAVKNLIVGVKSAHAAATDDGQGG